MGITLRMIRPPLGDGELESSLTGNRHPQIKPLSGILHQTVAPRVLTQAYSALYSRPVIIPHLHGLCFVHPVQRTRKDDFIDDYMFVLAWKSESPEIYSHPQRLLFQQSQESHLTILPLVPLLSQSPSITPTAAIQAVQQVTEGCTPLCPLLSLPISTAG